MFEKGGITFFRRKFLVSQCQKISWASLKCFRKFRVSKKFMHTRGYHVFPSKIFCLTVPKNFVGESFSVSLTSGPEKNWIKEGGCIKIFRRKFFCLSAENFCRGILYCTNNFGYRKSLDKGGGQYHDFPSEFLSHCIEIFHWRTLWCFRKILLSKIFMHRRGASRFCRTFVSQDRNEKLCKGTLLFSGNFLVSKKIYG